MCVYSYTICIHTYIHTYLYIYIATATDVIFFSYCTNRRRRSAFPNCFASKPTPTTRLSISRGESPPRPVGGGVTPTDVFFVVILFSTGAALPFQIAMHRSRPRLLD